MRPVDVLIFHPPATGSGPHETALATVRAELAGHHRRQFLAAGADSARMVTEPSDDAPFGDRLRRAIDAIDQGAADGPGGLRAPQTDGSAEPDEGGTPGPGASTRRGSAATGGLVILGSGALPMASLADRRQFVAVAAGAPGRALANNRYSADAVALADRRLLESMPALRGDNELPRWLEEHAGVAVTDLRDRWRLQVDLDSPLDVILASRDRAAAPAVREHGRELLAAPGRDSLQAALREVARVMGDRSAELVVVGRTSATALRWLETHTRCRIRAIVEERGVRAAGGSNRRPPRSLLGQLLDLDGPESLARQLARLGDAALIDSRVLLAHRLGADERAWPAPEVRFASDLLDWGAIADPWLRALTESAAAGGLPILLGGHSLVGPGLHLLGSAHGS